MNFTNTLKAMAEVQKRKDAKNETSMEKKIQNRIDQMQKAATAMSQMAKNFKAEGDATAAEILDEMASKLEDGMIEIGMRYTVDES